MKVKRKTNDHKEHLGNQTFKRNIEGSEKAYLQFNKDFGYIEGDTIVGVQHKNDVITLVEHL